MTEMTTHERLQRMYAHPEADRMPVTDYAWEATVERWVCEGMSADVGEVDYFGLDKIAALLGGCIHVSCTCYRQL